MAIPHLTENCGNIIEIYIAILPNWQVPPWGHMVSGPACLTISAILPNSLKALKIGNTISFQLPKQKDVSEARRTATLVPPAASPGGLPETGFRGIQLIA
jgi:hypothetical protein